MIAQILARGHLSAGVVLVETEELRSIGIKANHINKILVERRGKGLASLGKQTVQAVRAPLDSLAAIKADAQAHVAVLLLDM